MPPEGQNQPLPNESGPGFNNEKQPLPIAGYRKLTTEEIELINTIKGIGLTIADLELHVRQHLHKQRNDAVFQSMNAQADPSVTPEAKDACLAEVRRIDQAEPQRWASIARTHFQEGLMALTRAVAQPGGY